MASGTHWHYCPIVVPLPSEPGPAQNLEYRGAGYRPAVLGELGLAKFCVVRAYFWAPGCPVQLEGSTEKA